MTINNSESRVSTNAPTGPQVLHDARPPNRKPLQSSALVINRAYGVHPISWILIALLLMALLIRAASTTDSSVSAQDKSGTSLNEKAVAATSLRTKNEHSKKPRSTKMESDRNSTWLIPVLSGNPGGRTSLGGMSSLGGGHHN